MAHTADPINLSFPLSSPIIPSSYQVKVLEKINVSPSSPPPSSSPSTLPLTQFDLLVCRAPPVQRLFFYHLPSSTTTFIETHLPNLKVSLSTALHHFYPLAGAIVADEQTGNIPCLRYTEGDSVVLAVSESNDDFDELTKDGPKEASRFHPLVPMLPTCHDQKQPVMALQVTLFPDHGVGIGITTHHAAVDGSSSVHFMKVWSEISRTTGVEPVVPCPTTLPFFDRTIFHDPKGVVNEMQKIYHSKMTPNSNGTTSGMITAPHQDLARATFVFSSASLDKLRQLVMTHKPSISRPSDFTIAGAVTWTSLVKYRNMKGTNLSNYDTEIFAFPTDGRGRSTSTNGSPTVPRTYFGNCISPCVVEMARSDLTCENGVVMACAAIGDVIKSLKVGGCVPVEEWLSITMRAVMMNFISIVGSPRLGVYEVDFGWGKPKKVEVVSIVTTALPSLAENRDEKEGGVEIGFALPTNDMEAFTALFEGVLASF